MSVALEELWLKFRGEKNVLSCITLMPRTEVSTMVLADMAV